MAYFKFSKMHGCGNDFVVLDNRYQAVRLNSSLIKNICDRHIGIGCDQLIVLSKAETQDIHARYQFFNPDASEAEQCGNGQRCIAWYLHSQDQETFNFKVSGLAGVINSSILDDNSIKVNIGTVIQVVEKQVHENQVFDVQLANPHRVLQVHNVSIINLNHYKTLYTDIEDVNFEIVEIINKEEIKLRVHERGTGETLACGSGACAAVIALRSNQQLSDRVKVHLPGGDLVVEYNPTQDEIYLTGPAKFVFSGEYIYD
jgi:diaminopimelate epimerase